MNKLLALKEAGTTAFMLWGMGGVGKTQLALTFIQKIKSEFTAHIKIDLQGLTEPLTDIQVMFEVIKAFDPKIDVNLRNKEIEARFSQLINSHKTLLFLDNAVDEFQCAPLNIDNVFLIATSRENIYIDGGKTIKVDVLTNEDSQKLLFSIAEPQLFQNRELELGDLVERLPLALKPIAVLLQRRLIDIDELIEQLTSEKKVLELKDPLQKGSTVKAVFALSEKFLDHSLKKFWYEMGVFPSDFDVKAAAFISKTSEHNSKKNLRRLTSKSLMDLIELNLLEQLRTTQSERYRLHDLIRSYVREEIDSHELNELKKLFSTYYSSVMTALNKPTPELLSRFDLERINIENGFNWLKNQDESENEIARLCLAYTSYSTNVLFVRLHFQEVILWLEKGLSAARLLGNRRSEAARLNNLASTFWHLAEYPKAIEYFHQSLAISREINDAEGVSKNLGNLGSVYTILCDFRKAADYYGKSLEINTEINNEQGKASDMGNLGNIYRILGDPLKAIDHYEQTLIYCDKNDDLQFKASSLGNMGLIYSGLGENRKAIDFYNRSLEIAEKLKDRKIETTHRTGLGIVYKNLGNYQKAIESYEKALKLSREISDKLNIANVLGHLGVAYKNLRNFEKAIEYYQSALQITEEIGDKRGMANHLGNLGIAFKNLENYEKAIDYYHQAIEVTKSIKDKQGYGNWLGNLGNVYYLKYHRESVPHFNFR